MPYTKAQLAAYNAYIIYTDLNFQLTLLSFHHLTVPSTLISHTLIRGRKWMQWDFCTLIIMIQ